ncbi:hypothetical protein EJ08DRAFT_32250 [Tothia fuscella]|uniref:PARP catalytic domain-containing protein n=1 Tax=Tothia fuscella TaxID=1048955 RepID=A0A9P4NGB4_9PEZI|nr:hypothetical protein EJ08DRAFT_32250 [Tothia fuscella]
MVKGFRSLVKLKDDGLEIRKVDKIAGGLHPLDAQFPWNRLRDYVDRCVKRQRSLRIPEGLDRLLTVFIISHPQELKDVAVAACAHALSTETTLTLLNGHLRFGSTDFEALPVFIQILMAINHVNPAVISNEEAKLARNLFPLLALRMFDSGRMLQSLSTLYHTGIPLSSHLATHIEALAEQAAQKLSCQLEAIAATSSWMVAYRLCSWLAILPEHFESAKSGLHSLKSILDRSFPDWQAWSAWKPNQQDILMYEKKLGNAEHIALQDILALEGPDLASGGYTTLREGYIDMMSVTETTYFRNKKLEIELSTCGGDSARQALSSLSSALRIAATVKTSTNNCRMELFRQICIGKPIHEDGLKILEHCFSIGLPLVINDTNVFLQHYEMRSLPPMRNFQSLITALDTNGKISASPYQKLRELLGPKILETVDRMLESRLQVIQSIINVERAWTNHDLGVFEEMQSFGEVLLGTSWIMISASPDTKAILRQWPVVAEIGYCYDLYAFTFSDQAEGRKALAKKLARYLVGRFSQSGSLVVDEVHLVETLIEIWRKGPKQSQRRLAVALAGADLGVDVKFRCIAFVPSLESNLVSSLLSAITKNTFTQPEEASIVLAHSLASSHDVSIIRAFRPILFEMVQSQGEGLLTYTLENLGVSAWVTLAQQIETIFENSISGDMITTTPSLHPELLNWACRLWKDLDLLKRLERSKPMQHGSAMQCIIRGGSPSLQSDLVRIFDVLSSTFDSSRLEALHAVTAQLAADGGNVALILKAMPVITVTTLSGAEACVQVIECYEEAQIEVAETILWVWYNSSDLMPNDKLALEMIAEVLGLYGFDSPSFESLIATERHLQEEYTALLKEARRLEGLRLAFKSLDPKSTTDMLNSLGVEDSSPLDEIFDSIPTDLINVVERIGENEVELQIPLSNITALQKRAMGSGTAQSLLVRLVLENGLPPGFCMHFDNETEEIANSSGHFPWIALAESGDPIQPYCHGATTLATYQMSRLLSRHLVKNGFSTIQDIYTLIATEITALGSRCVVCGRKQNAPLRRAAVCPDDACQQIFDGSSLDVRLSDVRNDPAVTDLLLTMIYTIACSGTLNLLPGLPIWDAPAVKEIINALPPIAQLQHLDSLGAILSSLDKVRGSGNQTAKLLSWTCSNYRGFLTSATDTLKIPSLPGAHQFMLASAAPELEHNFAKKVGNGTTRVMFHGTSYERLYPILRGGLKDLSGTTLQRHGHSFGNGIYLASDPQTAFGFATGGVSSWTGSNFSNYRVLLGVELAGTWSPTSANSTIHVVTDPACVMVRYVFLVPSNATMPLVQHVTPAMSSVYASLRSGAI